MPAVPVAADPRGFLVGELARRWAAAEDAGRLLQRVRDDAAAGVIHPAAAGSAVAAAAELHRSAVDRWRWWAEEVVGLYQRWLRTKARRPAELARFLAGLDPGMLRAVLGVMELG